MKKLSAIIAAVLISLAVSIPVYAEPSGTGKARPRKARPRKARPRKARPRKARLRKARPKRTKTA